MFETIVHCTWMLIATGLLCWQQWQICRLENEMQERWKLQDAFNETFINEDDGT